MAHFDIVHAADPRYRGGTASALRGEIAAAAHWGINCALLPYLGQRNQIVSGFEPRLNALLDKTATPLLPPDATATCDILLAHHPVVFEGMPHVPIALRPKKVVCVLHHPLVDGQHRTQYDLNRVKRSLEMTYHAPVTFAPISSVVRKQLDAKLFAPAMVLSTDLGNIIDERDWPLRTRPAPRNTAILGRHSRSDPLKWPDSITTINQAYPDNDNFEIRILGDAILPDDAPLPPNWAVQNFREAGVEHFLTSLDFYVYFHSNMWVEAFGIAIAEALATGLVTLLPHSFEPVFGDGAVYCEPEEVRGVIEFFLSRPDEYERQSRAARKFIVSNHGLEAYPKRLRNMFAACDLETPNCIRENAIPANKRATPNAAAVPASSRILMVAGNGIGLGHITRLMAIANRLPGWIDPVFLTLSLGTKFIRKAGYSADYIPSHTKLSVTSQSWNKAFAVELLAAIDAVDARMVVFDGNDAFPGMRQIMKLRTDIAWVWIRRGLWQPHHELNYETIELFDMIIEPEDFASSEDGGKTAGLGGVEHVPPILFGDPRDRLSRAKAATKLNVTKDKPVVAVQLGSRQNFDLSKLYSEILNVLSELGNSGRITAIEIENPLAPKEEDATPGIGLRRLFPIFECSTAIDLLITTPGYNSFHESIYGGIPTIFVPNEAAEMDDQFLRTRVAQSAGLALTLTVADQPRTQTIIEQGLSAEFSKTVGDYAKGTSFCNGAVEAARLIGEFLISARTDLPFAQLLPRRHGK